MEKATLAGGCFWCTEAVFQRLKGVTSVTPGYSGGDLENPSYEQVSSGQTGHAEAIQIGFDPAQVKFEKLLEIFFKTHDPTTKNRQGHDVGPQYRSAVFYHNGEQKLAAESIINKLEEEKVYPDPIVTDVLPFKNFYKAEDYHINYYNQNKDAPYCQVVINPKLNILLKEFAENIR